MNSSKNIWAYRMAFIWFLLFSMNSLCTAIIGSLTGAQWSQLTGQSKLMIVIAISANWTGTIMAFVSKQAKRIEEGQDIVIPNGEDTTSVVQTTTTTQATTQTIPKP